MNKSNVNKKNMIKKAMDIYFKIFPMMIMRYHAYRVEKFIFEVSRNYNVDGKKVLDIGAEGSPYKKYFDKADYFSQDVVQNSEGTIDYVGDVCEGIGDIESSSFDCIVCTQVLEHLKEPKKAFEEFRRILKPGGKLFLTTHLCFEEHMIPYDYFRFTRYGLRYLGESAGFEVEHIEPHGGIFQVIALIADTLPIKLFFKKGLLYYLYIVLFTVPIFIFNLVCFLLDFLDRDKIMTLNYECTYKKKS